MSSRPGAVPFPTHTVGRDFQCFGVPFSFRSNDDTVLARMLEFLPPGSIETSGNATGPTYTVAAGSSAGGARTRYTLFECERPTLTAHMMGALLESLDSALRLEIGRQAPAHLFVHAGVVGWRDKAVLIPGASHSGKTTLVEALVRAGATYLSDEYALLDDQGLVHPFARLLSVRQGTQRRIRKSAVTDLGGTAGTAPLPLGLIISTFFLRDLQWTPNPISQSAGAMRLLENSLGARERPEFAMRIVAQAISGVVCCEGARGEAAAAAASILEFADITFSRSGARYP